MDQITSCTVTLKKLNQNAICVGSYMWCSYKNLPESYKDPSVSVRITGDKYPVLMIPLDSLQTVYVYNRDMKAEDLKKLPEFIAKGALGGAAVAGGAILSDALEDKDRFGFTDVKSKDILKSTVCGAALGAVIYPIFLYMDKTDQQGEGHEILQYSRSYPIHQEKGGYRIQLD